MSPLRVLATATAIELCFITAALSIAGLGGAASGWLDLVNCLAPLLLLVGIAAAAAARATLPPGLFRRCCIGLGLGGALIAAASTAPEILGAWTASPPRIGPHYRIATANVFRGNVMPFTTTRALMSRGADALFIQEGDEALQTARPPLAAAYPFSVRCPGGGVQIWLKTPILAQGCALPMPPDSYRTWGQAFAWARTLGPGGRPIILTTVHLGRPYPPTRQVWERTALAKALAGLPHDDMILAGDFNAAPWTFAMREQDRLLGRLSRRTHLLPTFPAQFNVTHSAWSLPFLPIDHVYASAEWRQTRIARFRIPDSDHFGIEADFVLAPQGRLPHGQA